MCVCVRILCVYRYMSGCLSVRKKSCRPCQYGASPEGPLVNCWGLVFGKQPNKLTIPMGQSKSAKRQKGKERKKEKASWADRNRAQMSPEWWRRERTHLHNANYNTGDFLFTCQKSNMHMHIHARTCTSRWEESQFDR